MDDRRVNIILELERPNFDDDTADVANCKRPVRFANTTNSDPLGEQTRKSNGLEQPEVV